MMNDPAIAVYEEFLSRYEQQFLAADMDEVFFSALGGEYETTLFTAVVTSLRSEVKIADDMLDKILSLFSPDSFFGQVLREELKKYRPEYVERPVT